MVELIKNKYSIANYDEAVKRRNYIITLEQAIAAAEKLDINKEEIIPIAVDVLYTEIYLGKFLIFMPKNKGMLKQGNKLPAVDSNDNGTFTVEQIAGSRDKSSFYQKLAKIPDDVTHNYIATCINEKNIPKSSELLNKKPHVSHNSGENEWFTPSHIIEAARNTMGGIDLDPASNKHANKIVKADKYYSEEDNGLEQEWYGNIWLNPPYSQPLIKHFSNAVVTKRNEYSQACVLVNNATETDWFQRMFYMSDAVCFLSGRVKFIDRNGESIGSPLQGQAILYFGVNIDKFKEYFESLGICVSRI